MYTTPDRRLQKEVTLGSAKETSAKTTIPTKKVDLGFS